MNSTFVVHVENKPGVLTRVSSLIRRRGFNIESLTVGHTETEGVSRMTIVVSTDDFGARRVEANLYKLIDVLRVDNVTQAAGGDPRPRADQGHGDARDAGRDHAARRGLSRAHHRRRAGVADDRDDRRRGEGRQLIEVLQPYGVLELARTGRVAMARGAIQQPEMHRDFEDVETTDDAAVSYSV